MNHSTTLLLLFFGFSLGFCSHFPLRAYYYVNLEKSWFDAQQYCRAHYTDLATFESMDDISRLRPNFSYSWAWIGLWDDPETWMGAMGNDTNSWRWSATGETSKTGYSNWNSLEPQSANADESCVILGSTGKWHDVPCMSFRNFVCYTATEQNGTTYEFFSTTETWTSAQTYCREHHTDLPTIESDADNNEVFSAKPEDAQIWIGLHRKPWMWSDKTQSSFRHWFSDQPDNVGGYQFCVLETPQHEWHDEVCQKEYPFICHEVSELKTVVNMKIKTDADMTDPAINVQILQQLGARLKSLGRTDVKLQWKIEPRKQENEDV